MKWDWWCVQLFKVEHTTSLITALLSTRRTHSFQSYELSFRSATLKLPKVENSEMYECGLLVLRSPSGLLCQTRFTNSDLWKTQRHPLWYEMNWIWRERVRQRWNKNGARMGWNRELNEATNMESVLQCPFTRRIIRVAYTEQLVTIESEHLSWI